MCSWYISSHTSLLKPLKSSFFSTMTQNCPCQHYPGHAEWQIQWIFSNSVFAAFPHEHLLLCWLLFLHLSPIFTLCPHSSQGFHCSTQDLYVCSLKSHPYSSSYHLPIISSLFSLRIHIQGFIYHLYFGDFWADDQISPLISQPFDVTIYLKLAVSQRLLKWICLSLNFPFLYSPFCERCHLQSRT